MNWGFKIVIASALFMGYIIFLVVKCMQQDVSLVDKHYYKEEIEYQAQIEKIRNATESKELLVKFDAHAGEIHLVFATSETKSLSGKVQLFRPSDQNMDKTFELKLDEKGLQSISTAQLSKGLWKVKVSWTNGSEEFFKEEVVVI